MILCVNTMPSTNKFTSSLLSLCHYFFFHFYYLLSAMAKTSIEVVRMGIFFLVPNLTETVQIFNNMLDIDPRFFINVIYKVRTFASTTKLLQVLILKECQIS